MHLCLDAETQKPSGPVILRPCSNGSSAQQWHNAAPNGYLVNPASGLCLDTQGSPAAGAIMVTDPCSNSTSGELWTYDAGTAHLTNLTNNMCLDTAGTPTDGVAAVLNPCGSSDSQRWQSGGW